MVIQVQSKVISYVVFLATLTIVLISLVSVVFPSLIVSSVSLHENDFDPFEPGALMVPLFVVNTILLGIGFAYYKKKLPVTLHRYVERLLNFEISRRVALIATIILLTIYIAYTIPELSLNEEEQYPDYQVLKQALVIWPSAESDNLYVKEQNSRYVRMFLLDTSQKLFQNIKILPFIASILVVIVTYFFTYQISRKRFAGIASMAVLLQSYTFLKYDTIAVYENFWVLFYLMSLYVISKRWYLSAVFYLFSVFTKAFSAPFVLMNIFFVYRSNLGKRKNVTMISYGIVISVMLLIFWFSDTIYNDIIRFKISEFWIGFTAWSYQMILDKLIILTILPLTIALFLTSKRGIKEADSILILFFGTLLVGPILALLTDFYFILPYRFVPFIVFFAVGVGVFLSKNHSKIGL